MRTVQRNKRDVWYALYLGEQEVVDEDGNFTGETEIAYSEPVHIRANVSPATGNTNMEMFGNFADYSRVVVTDDVSIPVNENAVMWIDKEPIEGHGIEGYNYIVRRVAKSFNSVAIAVRDVDVDVEPTLPSG